MSAHVTNNVAHVFQCFMLAPFGTCGDANAVRALPEPTSAFGFLASANLQPFSPGTQGKPQVAEDARNSTVARWPRA